MKNILLSIYRLMTISNLSNIIFVITIYLINILLIILHRKWKNDDKINIWKYLCFIPLLISIIHFSIYGLGYAWIYFLGTYIVIYIPAILMAIWSIFSKNKKSYIIITIFINIIMIICSFFALVNINKIANYSLKRYDKAFISLCDYMKKNYVLAEWKNIDFDKLKDYYIETMKIAEKTNNKELYYETLEAFISNIYDGHVSISSYKEDSDYILPIARGYHDYGLSLTLLDNGDVIAIDVEEEITNKYGIENGSIITYWNKEEINKALDKIKVPLNLPIKENEEKLKPFYLAATGSEEVIITFIDENNNPKEVSIPYFKEQGLRHLKSYGSLTKTYLEDENFSTKMLSNNVGYLKVSSESTIDKYDMIAYLTLNHEYARNMFREKLRSLKEQGMIKLVIDIRNNIGGYDEVGVALVELLADKEYFAYANGVIKNGKYQKTVSSYIKPDGEFKDLEVVVLTSMKCGSAGDGLALYLSKLPNVTLVGLTPSEGINQETGGTIYMPDGLVINFPVGLVVNEDDEPNIDTNEKRINRIPLDIKIPYTKEAAIKIFAREGDYELEWILDYLNS